MTDTIGFIGLGYMGHGMAKNIVEKGFALRALPNRKREAIEDLVGRGATEASSVAEIGETCDMVVLCLPGSPEVEAVVTGPGGLLSTARSGLVILDSSTSNPVSTRRLAELCAEKGVSFVDAPLSRTPKEAWTGTLDCMVGATPELFEKVRPLIDTWSGKIVHTGDIGSGHTMKLLNNFLSLGYGALYAEALAIGQKSGVSPEIFHSVLTGGRMDCGFYQTFMQYVVGRDRDAHKFTLKNAHKDTRYLVSMANESGVSTHIASAVKNSYATAESIGRGDDFVPMLSDIVAELNGIKRED
ncbi:2-hydroxy-3-oxopropionate reductase [Aureimonas sp. SA4125]|uniref:NAD(P)-dependent oxidoreductase n=1 Tax=Aureimonas sp. SA4125 TaxID=2826993 RepID=UPI001CC6324F|nr:NAD(P)-dependent oxidoreductase [Aureimonas sp. SA4125]BDA83666.1 2-hydroxy-3-oxopropionate reductase [Aureimonas sp. SA4125]